MSQIKGNPRVFVIDDDPVFNDLIRRVLKKYNVETEIFQDPAMLLNRVQEHHPDLCIVDLNLGARVKGHDLIDSLREMLDPVKNSYVTYLEFEQGNVELSQKVREWILAKG